MYPVMDEYYECLKDKVLLIISGYKWGELVSEEQRI